MYLVRLRPAALYAQSCEQGAGFLGGLGQSNFGMLHISTVQERPCGLPSGAGLGGTRQLALPCTGVTFVGVWGKSFPPTGYGAAPRKNSFGTDSGKWVGWIIDFSQGQALGGGGGGGKAAVTGGKNAGDVFWLQTSTPYGHKQAHHITHHLL